MFLQLPTDYPIFHIFLTCSPSILTLIYMDTWWKPFLRVSTKSFAYENHQWRNRKIDLHVSHHIIWLLTYFMRLYLENIVNFELHLTFGSLKENHYSYEHQINYLIDKYKNSGQFLEKT